MTGLLIRRLAAKAQQATDPIFIPRRIRPAHDPLLPMMLLFLLTGWEARQSLRAVRNRNQL